MTRTPGLRYLRVVLFIPCFPISPKPRPEHKENARARRGSLANLPEETAKATTASPRQRLAWLGSAAEDPDGWMDRVSKVALPLWPFCTRLSCPVPRVYGLPSLPNLAGPALDWETCCWWCLSLCNADACATLPRQRKDRHEGSGRAPLSLSFPFLSMPCHAMRASTQ
jgi:hypothetical protein